MEVRVNGTMLHCESAGAGPSLLCLHGGPGTDASGVRPLARLAGTLGVRFVSYDHRGHGRSEWVPVEQCTHAQLVADVEGVREALGLGRITLLGISWGGYLGLMYAARYPAALDRLIVVGASPSHEFMKEAEANARREATPEQWRAYRSLWDGSIHDDAAFRRAFETIRPLYHFDKGLVAGAPAAGPDVRYRVAVRNFVLHHEFPAYDVRPELGRIACPTLVLVGRHDWISPVGQAEEIARGIPGARLVVFERSGHSPHVEEPEAFLREVQAFLAA
jgi:proline iminopeptidase